MFLINSFYFLHFLFSFFPTQTYFIHRSQEGFVGDSFETISASGPNGAIIHYKPQEDTDRPLGKKEMYLLDSGAQFFDGTTDVTRTLHFGVPSQHQKECFTRVVKGHIALASVIFPKKIKGSVLDTLARKPLVCTYNLSTSLLQTP